MYRVDDTAWKFWFFISVLLLGGMTLQPALLWWAVLLSAFQVGHYWYEATDFRDLTLQVRLAYLALVCLGCAPALAWIHAALLLGTLVVVATDYCLLERVLVLAPWNRQWPIDLATLSRALLTAPRNWQAPVRRATLNLSHRNTDCVESC